MTFEQLKDHLQTKREFADWDSWTVSPMADSRASPHCYRLQRGGRNYFVNEVEGLESNIHKLLIPLSLRHVPKVIYPDLLDEMILVAEYVHGSPITTKELEPSLIGEYAAIQDQTDPLEFGTDEEKGRDPYFANSVLHSCDQAQRILADLNERGLPAAKKHIELLEALIGSSQELAHEHNRMPWARVHHDFREKHILGRDPQMIVDWGSSYGTAPFMFDLAPFVLNRPDSLDVFVEHSDVCRRFPRAVVERWVYVAAFARYVEMLRYLYAMANSEEADHLQAYLDYQYPTYRSLLPG